jgi:hypothetical protein
LNTKIPLPGHAIPQSPILELMQKIDWNSPIAKVLTTIIFLPFLLVIVTFPLRLQGTICIWYYRSDFGSLISKYFHNRFVSLLLMVFSSIMTMRYLYCALQPPLTLTHQLKASWVIAY